MKKLLLVMLVLAVSAGFAGTPMTNAGDKALSFSVNGLGNFGVTGIPAGSISAPSASGGGTISSSMYGFGGKYFLSQNMAVRGVLSFNMVSSSEDPVPNSGNTGNEEFSVTQLAIAPGLEWHMDAAGAVSPYWGVQAVFGMLSNSFTPFGTTGGPAAQEVTGSGTAFGAALFMGAEWFPWDGVSFNAEYQLGFSTSSTEGENGSVTVDGPTITEIGINSWAVGLNVYLGQ